MGTGYMLYHHFPVWKLQIGKSLKKCVLTNVVKELINRMLFLVNVMSNEICDSCYRDGLCLLVAVRLTLSPSMARCTTQGRATTLTSSLASPSERSWPGYTTSLTRCSSSHPRWALTLSHSHWVKAAGFELAIKVLLHASVLSLSCAWPIFKVNFSHYSFSNANFCSFSSKSPLTKPSKSSSESESSINCCHAPVQKKIEVINSTKTDQITRKWVNGDSRYVQKLFVNVVDSICTVTVLYAQ